MLKESAGKLYWTHWLWAQCFKGVFKDLTWCWWGIVRQLQGSQRKEIVDVSLSTTVWDAVLVCLSSIMLFRWVCCIDVSQYRHWWLDEADFTYFCIISFSGVIKLMLVLPGTTVRSQGCWHPSAWDLAAGTNAFTLQTCLEMHYVLFGVPEGRIWLQRSLIMGMDVAIYLLWILDVSCFSLWIASLLYCLNKHFIVLYHRTSGSLLGQEPLDLPLLI